MPKAADETYLARAVELAGKGEGHTRPNPPVGAVIVKDGVIIGEGYHRRAGCDHAEAAALKNAARRGNPVKGASMFVTLEPCSRPGRVGACTDRIVAAGIGRVVYACRDPNPKNRGRAKRILARAGIVCEQVSLAAADRLIAPFAKHVTTGMPYVTVKLAMSLDGRICDDFGGARWISSAEARRLTGRFRRRVDAIMVGTGTVRADDPVLLPHDGRNDDLVRVVVTRSGRLPEKAKVLSDGRNETLVFKIGRGQSLEAALSELGSRGIMHVLCEGGMELAVSLAEAGLVDEWVSVLSPCVIGTRPVSEKLLFEPVRGNYAVRVKDDTIARFRCLRG